MRLLLTLFLHFALGSVVSAQEETPFRPLTFERAFEVAEAEGRLVLACFVSADSEDCRRMRENTWSDDGVSRWLEVETVAIELDRADREDLVQRLGIVTFPTVVVAASDGTELDRIRGYARPRHFILAFTGMLEAREMIFAARARLAEAPEDPAARLEMARALATGKGKESALEQYTWIWTETRGDPAYRHMRVRKVLTEVELLAVRFSPARQRMLKWRRTALGALETGELDDQLLAARELSALNSHLSEPAAMLELYLKMRDAGDVPQELLDALFDGQVAAQLYNQKRYEELLAGLRDPLVRVEKLFVELEEIRARVADGRLPPEETSAADVMQSGLFASSSLYFETLLRVGRRDEAVELMEYVVTREPVAQSYIVMMRAARKAREPKLAKKIAADGLELLDKKSRAQLQRAYDQLFKEG